MSIVWKFWPKQNKNTSRNKLKLNIGQGYYNNLAFYNAVLLYMQKNIFVTLWKSQIFKSCQWRQAVATEKYSRWNQSAQSSRRGSATLPGGLWLWSIQAVRWTVDKVHAKSNPVKSMSNPGPIQLNPSPILPNSSLSHAQSRSNQGRIQVQSCPIRV